MTGLPILLHGCVGAILPSVSCLALQQTVMWPVLVNLHVRTMSEGALAGQAATC